jgi:orotate phosphoribosyltransferase
MKPERDELIDLLAANSFRLGEFTLSSGLKSDYYIDCRTTTLHARGAELTGRVFLDLFRQQGWQPRAVGGLTMGADPVVVAVSVISSQAGVPVHGFLVRKQEKAHGMGRRIEGFQEKGAPIVIVDDVCTTGSSTIQAIEAARDFGFQIVGVACLVEREEAGGRPAVAKAAAPAPFVSIFRSAEIKAAHLKLKGSK